MKTDTPIPTKTDSLRIQQVKDIITPESLINELPITPLASSTVYKARKNIHDILNKKDNRMVVIVGPCSIHDPASAMDYANKLSKLHEKLSGDLQIIMRVYFEKPRTTIGWKGLINDPNLDGSFNINEGLYTARKLLLDITELGLPTATEFLDLVTPQYVTDLVSWGAIGARTTESQVHREMVSGLSCPVGFKNGTDGSINTAIDAIYSSQHQHHFLSITKSGKTAIFSTLGNSDCHLILRGGASHTNYSEQHIEDAAERMQKSGITPNIMIDCSHGNSRKQHEQQLVVARNICNQLTNGNNNIMGVMLESNLISGRQDLQPDSPLTYGQSITDACIGWEETETILIEIAKSARTRTIENVCSTDKAA